MANPLRRCRLACAFLVLAFAGSCNDPAEAPDLATERGTPVDWSALAVRPGPGDCLLIPASVTLVVDDLVDVERLQILGTVVLEDTAARTIRASQIAVAGSGKLRAGSASTPFVHDAELHLVAGAGTCTRGVRLNANGSLTNIGTGGFMDHGAQTVMVHDAGRLELFGTDPGPTAAHLVATAAAASTGIELPLGTDWSSPAQIVVAPSGFQYDEAEERTMELAAVGMTESWGFVDPLAFDHYVSPATTTALVPVAAEAALLDRNIRVHGSPTPTTLAADCSAYNPAASHLEFDGAEIMVEGDGVAILEHVELYDVGKFDRLRHYPIHFHLLGPSESRVIGCAIHRSFNRGVVVHGTADVEVIDNVVYDVVGHAFYLEEDDAEVLSTRSNRVLDNLAVQVHGCAIDRVAEPQAAPEPADEISDFHDESASGFFFTDPRNALVGNVAAGAFSAGFWWNDDNAGEQYNLCGDAHLFEGGVLEQALDMDPDTIAYPSGYDADYGDIDTTCRGSFVDNTAHSSKTGLWAEEHKTQTVRIAGFKAWKNHVKALELKNHGVTEIVELSATDNPTTLWPASHAFHVGYRPRILLIESTLVGEDAERPVEYPRGDDRVPFYGVEVYEGRLYVADTAFGGYDEASPARGMRAAFGRHQSFPFYSNDPDNAIENVSFEPGTRPLWFDDPEDDTRTNPRPGPDGQLAASGFQSVTLLDVSGDIDDAGEWIVANDRFNYPGDGEFGIEPGATYMPEANAWSLIPEWNWAQLLVEWCAQTVTEGPGSARCLAHDASGEALPSRDWNEIAFTPQNFDLVRRVVFTDFDDCGFTTPCEDVVAADHHNPQGSHNLMATNIRTGAMYLVDFFDFLGEEDVLDLSDENLAHAVPFSDVEAIQLHLRYATDTAQVSVAVPSEPVCVVSYLDSEMDVCTDVTETADQPDAPGEWRWNAANGRVALVPWIGEDTSVLMVFDAPDDGVVPSCPCCGCPMP